jgi:hypothetical protein
MVSHPPPPGPDDVDEAAHFFDLGGPSHYSGNYPIGFEHCDERPVCERSPVRTRRYETEVGRLVRGVYNGVLRFV